MKYIKLFELFNETSIPQLGDYVVCKEHGVKIGRIIRFIGASEDTDDPSYAAVLFNEELFNISDINNPPDEVWATKKDNGDVNTEFVTLDNIKYWAKNIEDIRLVLAGNIYNL